MRERGKFGGRAGGFLTKVAMGVCLRGVGAEVGGIPPAGKLATSL